MLSVHEHTFFLSVWCTLHRIAGVYIYILQPPLTSILSVKVRKRGMKMLTRTTNELISPSGNVRIIKHHENVHITCGRKKWWGDCGRRAILWKLGVGCGEKGDDLVNVCWVGHVYCGTCFKDISTLYLLYVGLLVGLLKTHLNLV